MSIKSLKPRLFNDHDEAVNGRADITHFINYYFAELKIACHKLSKCKEVVCL